MMLYFKFFDETIMPDDLIYFHSLPLSIHHLAPYH